MKIKAIIILSLLALSSNLFAESPKHKGGKHHFKKEFFELIIQNVDIKTANELQAEKKSLKKEREAIRLLEQANVGDTDEIKALRKAHRAKRKALGKRIRSIVDNDKSLKQLLKEQRKSSREEHKIVRKIINPKNDANFQKLLALATPEQATILKANKVKLDASFKEHKGKKSDKRKQERKDKNKEGHHQFRELMKQQKNIVVEILEANPNFKIKD